MCLACEQEEYFFRAWCASFLARGEMPPGVAREDLEAMGFELPAAMRRRDQPGATTASPAGAFACDSPDGE